MATKKKDKVHMESNKMTPAKTKKAVKLLEQIAAGSKDGFFYVVEVKPAPGRPGDRLSEGVSYMNECSPMDIAKTMVRMFPAGLMPLMIAIKEQLFGNASEKEHKHDTEGNCLK